jgi:hypothetical protein
MRSKMSSRLPSMAGYLSQGRPKLKHFYAASIIGLGAWEATAFASRRRVWTVTGTVRHFNGKQHKAQRAATKGVVALYLIGAGVHLLRQAADE